MNKTEKNPAKDILNKTAGIVLNNFLTRNKLSVLAFFETLNHLSPPDEKDTSSEAKLLREWQGLDSAEKIRLIISKIPLGTTITVEKLTEVLGIGPSAITFQLSLLVSEGILEKSRGQDCWKKIYNDVIIPDRDSTSFPQGGGSHIRTCRLHSNFG